LNNFLQVFPLEPMPESTTTVSSQSTWVFDFDTGEFYKLEDE